MKLSTLVTPAAVVVIVMATITYAQRPVPAPHIDRPTTGRDGGRGGIRPCSGLQGPGSCAPGPSIDVTRYVPPANALSGALRLIMQPASAAVYLDGRYVGRVNEFDDNSERLVVSSGSHTVVVRAPGYEPIEIDTRIHAGQTTVYRGTLSPSRGHD